MKLPNISDPALPAKVIDSDKQTFLNPYTDKVEKWNERKPFITGARGNWNSFTFILGEVRPNTKANPPAARPLPKFKGEPFSTSRSFVMKFDEGNGTGSAPPP